MSKTADDINDQLFEQLATSQAITNLVLMATKHVQTINAHDASSNASLVDLLSKTRSVFESIKIPDDRNTLTFLIGSFYFVIQTDPIYSTVPTNYADFYLRTRTPFISQSKIIDRTEKLLERIPSIPEINFSDEDNSSTDSLENPLTEIINALSQQQQNLPDLNKAEKLSLLENHILFSEIHLDPDLLAQFKEMFIDILTQVTNAENPRCFQEVETILLTSQLFSEAEKMRALEIYRVNELLEKLDTCVKTLEEKSESSSSAMLGRSLFQDRRQGAYQKFQSLLIQLRETDELTNEQFEKLKAILGKEAIQKSVPLKKEADLMLRNLEAIHARPPGIRADRD